MAMLKNVEKECLCFGDNDYTYYIGEKKTLISVKMQVKIIVFLFLAFKTCVSSGFFIILFHLLFV